MPQPTFADPPARVSPAGRPAQATSLPTFALAAAVLGFFVITLDAVVVNVSLPSIRGDLGGGITGLQWVVDGYTLMFAALSDRIGARRALTAALGAFVVTSAACGMAPTLGALVVARFAQGSAAAVMMPSSMALLGQAYPEAVTRARAVAMWAMGGAIASSAGPVLGGLLTLGSWRFIFFINVPVGAVAMLLLAKTAPSQHGSAPLDWFGQLIAVTSMGALTYGAIEAGAVGFAAPPVAIAVVVAVAGFAMFVALESRIPHPMLPLALFSSRHVRIPVAVGFAFVVGYYGLPFVMSLYLQEARHLSPFGAGVVFLPMMLAGAAVTPFSARIAERMGPRAVISGGLLMMGAGLGLLAVVPAATPVWALALLMVVVGLAGPLVMPPVTAVLLEDVGADQAGTASGVFNTSRQIGGALAVAVFGALLAHQGDVLEGVRASLLIAAAVAVTAAATARRLGTRAGGPHAEHVRCVSIDGVAG